MTIGRTRRILAVALLISWARTGNAQTTRQIFVSVRDDRGTPAVGLQPNQFVVVEDEMVRTTVKVEAIDWPTRLTVMVDNATKAPDYLLSLRNGLRGLFSRIPQGLDASLLSLAPQPRWVVRPTTDAKQLAGGIDLISPAGGVAKFFDGLAEAADRAAKDKASSFPVFLVIVTTIGGNRDVPLTFQLQKLQQQLVARAATVHFVVVTQSGVSATGVTGGLQTNLGLGVTQLTGGRFENINSPSRLEALLPEIGDQIASSAAIQRQQYRITYEAPSDAPYPKQVLVNVQSVGARFTIATSLDGHLPMTTTPEAAGVSVGGAGRSGR